jgi:hypothetical protein
MGRFLIDSTWAAGQARCGGNAVSVENVLNQLVAASSSALDSITGKMRGLFGVREPASSPVLDEETVRDRERQSIRIKLRMLAHGGRIEDLVQIAQTTEDEETSRVAVNEIDDATIDDIQYLERLARSRSRSTVRAVVRIFNRKETQLAKEIFLQHLQNGTFAELVRSDTVKLFSILDLLGVFEQAMGQDTMLAHFLKLWGTVEGDAVSRNVILAEILGDPEPGGFRCVYEASLIPKVIRMKALELLQVEDPAGCERACIYATNDDEHQVAYPAAAWLYNYWQGAGIQPSGIETMPMLDVNLLYQLCAMTTTFQWRDSEQADEQVERYSQLKDAIATCDQTQDPVQHVKLQRQIQDLERELLKTTERRINRLQPLVDNLCAALRLPNPRLLPSDDEGSEASYCVGMGVIKIARHNLLTDQPLSERLMSAMLHEICHMQQDVLIIRMIADDLNLEFGRHGKLLIPLWDKYSDGVGYAPDNVFLLAVLRLRNDQRLTDAEKSRAVKLYDDALKLNLVSDEIKSVKRRGAHLEKSLDSLRKGAFDSCLLTVLRDQHKLQNLFHFGRIPEVLMNELSICKTSVDDLANAVNPGVRDTIELVQQWYNEPENRAYVEPVVNRLKRLLNEVLEEELKILHRKMSKLKRDGYQEAEAYVVSDRAEVIIKAMRKGWFEVAKAQ